MADTSGFGFLNIYKPSGMTSHDVISVLRKISKVKQIGHAGTLDPFAQGVLPVAFGKATRLLEYLDGDKAYTATVQFGKNTDTYDIDGVVTETFNKKVSESELKDALKNFEGEIVQTPPVYSAIKINGKKLYEYAREGESPEIPTRKVIIKSIFLNAFDFEKQSAEISVECSKGTYIRSIAYDLGRFTGCGAYLSKLIRTKSGMFCVDNSTNLQDFTDMEFIKAHLINPLEMLDLPKIAINEEEYKKVICGQILLNNSQFVNDLVILVYNNSVSAVALAQRENIKVKKVFV